MNVSTGSPHILLFERDQQLTTLLTREFQLAGYQCHAARTAVEVFDAISRYPVRLLLLNLALPTVGRREFWVALDAQRKGREVQTFTYRCMNLAGYGPEDLDEQGRSMLADMEVDGMPGIKKLVEAVHMRISRPTTDQLSSVPPVPIVDRQVPGEDKVKVEVVPIVIPLSTSSTQSFPSGSSYSALAELASSATFLSQQSPVASSESTTSALAELASSATFLSQQSPNSSTPTSTFLPQQPSESTTSALAELASSATFLSQQSPNSSTPTSTFLPQQPSESTTSALAELASSATFLPQQPPAVPPNSSTPTSTDRIRAVIYPGQGAWSTPGQSNSPNSAAQLGSNVGKVRMVNPGGSLSAAQPQSSEGDEVSSLARLLQDKYTPNQGNLAQDIQEEAQAPRQDMLGESAVSTQVAWSQQFAEEYSDARVKEDGDTPDSLFEQVQASMQGVLRRRDGEVGAASENPILDIVENLPPMSAPVLLPVSDRSVARSLGSVLLEGRVVQQSRLEVAHSVQRMLRGVQLNYQLGEILLMLKLLTPDQLLAASLVSYGLISTVQISALGRIRQELHAIGLEYDLENLLMLFRILTPEQLREVRAGW